jgi:GT2 family glycosyltransferase
MIRASRGNSIWVAALLTCFNRRETTLAALRRLFQQRLPEQVELAVLLVDDGSTDGTGAAVRSEFPQVRLIEGNGSLYWNGGMRVAFGEALKEGFDYYFWLNDDALLEPDAIAQLIGTHRRRAGDGHERSLIVGAFTDPDTGDLTYGGVVRCSQVHPLKFRLVPLSDEPQLCDAANGNAVLIPASVARAAGNLEPGFRHAMGDFDYCLRAQKLGCAAWVAPGTAGTCRKNGVRNSWKDPQLSFGKRVRLIFNVKGLPFREYSLFARLHGGALWPVFCVLPYMRMFMGCLLVSFNPKLHSRQKVA